MDGSFGNLSYMEVESIGRTSGRGHEDERPRTKKATRTNERLAITELMKIESTFVICNMIKPYKCGESSFCQVSVAVQGRHLYFEVFLFLMMTHIMMMMRSPERFFYLEVIINPFLDYLISRS